MNELFIFLLIQIFYHIIMVMSQIVVDHSLVTSILMITSFNFNLKWRKWVDVTFLYITSKQIKMRKING